MKRLLLLILMLVHLTQAKADDFPERYNRQKLAEAKASIFVETKRVAAGEVTEFQYAGMPIFVYRRTTEDIDFLKKTDKSQLADPNDENFLANIKRTYGSSISEIWARLSLSAQSISKKKYTRSLTDDLAVLAGWSTETGCLLRFIKPKDRVNPNALFLDPCSKATYDSAGHIFAENLIALGMPRAVFSNLIVPPHYSNVAGIYIGIAAHTALPHLPFNKEELYDRSTSTQLLMSAAKYNDMNAIQSALKNGADINSSKIGVGSAIDAAIMGSSFSIVKLLVDLGAKPTERTAGVLNLVNRPDIAVILKMPTSPPSMQ